MGQLVKFRPGQIHIQMLGPFIGRSDERKVDVRCGGSGKLLLGLLRSLFQSLESHLVAGQVNALRFLKLVDKPLGNAVVKVIAAQSRIAVGGKHLDHAVADLDDGHIKRTAAQVVYHDLLLFFIVKAVGQGRGRRLVDDPLYIQSGDLARVLGCLTLRVVKIRGNRDDRFCHGLAQIALRVRFQLLQDHSRDLLGSILLPVNIHLVIASHMPFDGRDGLVSVGNRLALCRLAYQPLPCLCKRYDGRRGPDALRVGDNRRLAAFHNGHTAVGCT